MFPRLFPTHISCAQAVTKYGLVSADYARRLRKFSLAPNLSKALEWAILLTYTRHFTTSDLQFGYKKGESPTLFISLIKNVVARFVHNCSLVFGCFLDASKAFDRVNHGIFFSVLSMDIYCNVYAQIFFYICCFTT